MNFKETYSYIKQDFKRNKWGSKTLISNSICKQVFFFRIGSYLKEKSFLWKPLHGLVAIYYTHLKKVNGIELRLGTKVGPGVHFAHGFVVINPRSVIGKNVSFYQFTTLGVSSPKDWYKAPIVGDNVRLWTGATVIGNVSIGNNSEIGANAVVLKDIPANAVAVGIPAMIKRVKETVSPDIYNERKQ